MTAQYFLAAVYLLVTISFSASQEPQCQQMNTWVVSMTERYDSCQICQASQYFYVVSGSRSQSPPAPLVQWV